MSRQMLEAAYRGALDRRMLEELNEEWDIACESVHHAAGAVGHVRHSGPAAFLQVSPCGHGDGFRCATSVKSYDPALPMYCPDCCGISSLDDYKFLPITDES